MSLASGRRPMRENGKSIMSGSQKRLKRKGSTAASESGPPSWNSTTPTRFEFLTISPDPQRIGGDVTKKPAPASMNLCANLVKRKENPGCLFSANNFARAAREVLRKPHRAVIHFARLSWPHSSNACATLAAGGDSRFRQSGQETDTWGWFFSVSSG